MASHTLSGGKVEDRCTINRALHAGVSCNESNGLALMQAEWSQASRRNNV